MGGLISSWPIDTTDRLSEFNQNPNPGPLLTRFYSKPLNILRTLYSVALSNVQFHLYLKSTHPLTNSCLSLLQLQTIHFSNRQPATLPVLQRC